MGRIQRPARNSVRPPSQQRGDTIVEVLISLIVISMIITGAFIVSHTSTQHIRTSQEHTEALELLQGQVEMLRAAVKNTPAPGNWRPGGGNFCMDRASGEAVLVSSGPTCNIKLGSSDYSYNVVISDVTPEPDPTFYGDTYKLAVSWDALGGGTNQESIVYRVAQP